MKKTIWVGIVLLLSSLTAGQVTFQKVPQNRQLYGRNLTTDSAAVGIIGTVNNTGTAYSEIRVRMYRNNSLQSSITKTLAFSGTTASFACSLSIKAELALHRFEIYGYNGTAETLIRKADSVVCGDVYIISGQSNAEAHSFSGSSSAFVSPYVRVLGLSVQTAGDTLWYIGQGDGAQNTVGNTGQWGLRMARLLVDSLKMPIAIFNGCRSGMSIDWFVPASTSGNYAMLKSRFAKSGGLASYARAIFWFQGEQDANTGMALATYKNKFDTLRTQWLKDYPNVKKIYVFQIGSGCNTTSGLSATTYRERVNVIKEAHRQIAHTYGDSVVNIASSEGNRYVDGSTTQGCHFPFTNGYELLGINAYQLLARDFYSKGADNIASPTIKFAELSGAQEITLTMENIMDSLKWAPMSDTCFRLEGITAKVQPGTTYWNKVKLPLSAIPAGITGISYLGHDFTADPLVSTLKGVGAIHFYKYPITTASYRDSLCTAIILKKNLLSLSVDAVATYNADKRIVGLNLAGRSIITIPADIGYMDSLKTINLSNNPLTTLPREITKLSPSVSLVVSQCRLCNVSDTLATWITKYTGSAVWQSTQMSDNIHYCSGTAITVNSQPQQDRRIFEYKVSDRTVVLTFKDPGNVRLVRLIAPNGAVCAQYGTVQRVLRIHTDAHLKGMFILQVKTLYGTSNRRVLVM